jgi:hypothetical protein
MTKLQTVTVTTFTCAMLYIGATSEGYIAQAMLCLAGFNIHGIISHIKGE